ncbi:MAG TPA: tRNA lysidine(34) synthetase TilS [Dongiaceae bacterium]
MPDIDIARLMAPLGPFERTPAIAAAVSGGSDSLGLGLLLAAWARAQGGHLHVLTVDHGLRPEAAAECKRVAEIFAAVPGCSCHALQWQGNKPVRGIQAAARGARYALLTEWCRARGILHLAIAHTAEDQAETIVMRQAHRSGATGLAGMAAVRTEGGVRLLRPLLPVSRAAIRSWLQARGQDWIEDPSNENAKYERVRVRQGLTPDRSAKLFDEARRFGEARDARERAAARLLAEAGQVHEAGYVSLALVPWAQAAPDVQAAVLRQVMLAVSGQDYLPSFGGLAAPLGSAARTLGGCALQALQGRLHVFREAASIAEPVVVAAGWSGTWDNRFGLQVGAALERREGWTIAPLGEHGLRQAVHRFGIRLKRHPIPLPARLALPALWQGEHLAAQPHLHLGRGLAAWPAPRHTVTTCGFTVAGGRPHTIYSPVLC